MTEYLESGVEQAAGQVRVFVNYRRAETKHVAGRLRDQITARLGEDSVFVDVEDIEPGLDYVTAIDTAVGSCHVMLVLIGEGWLEHPDEQGLRRIDDPSDRLRIEIEAGLRNRTRVIPVLVDSASMPKAKDLPAPLVPLARHQAIRVRHESFRSDVDHLVTTVERVSRSRASADVRSPRVPVDRTREAARWMTFGILVLVLLAHLALRDGLRDAVAESRPRLPDGGPWASLVWLLPSLPVIVAAWLVATRRRPGVALGCIAGAATWVCISWALVTWRAQESATGAHLLLLGLLVASIVALVVATPEARHPVRRNRWDRALLACALTGVAIILRVQSSLVAEITIPSAESGPLLWADMFSPPFWIAFLPTLLVCLPAAALQLNRTQARVFVTLALLQVLDALVLRLVTLPNTLVNEDDPLLAVAEDLVFLTGSVCMLVAVWTGQRARPAHRS
jgi:hypothetical protein